MNVRMKPVFFCIISILSIALASLVWGQGPLDMMLAEDSIYKLRQNNPIRQRKPQSEPQSDDSSAKYRSPSLSDSGVVTNEGSMGKLSDLLKKSSTLKIYYAEVTHGYGIIINAIGMATGATVEFRPSISHPLLEPRVMLDDDTWVIELDKNEWHEFISALHNSGVGKWKRWYRDEFGELGRGQWTFKISEGRNVLLHSTGHLTVPPRPKFHYPMPPNWEAFTGVIDRLIGNIRPKHEIQHYTEYRKKFGVSMTEFQRSIEEVSLYDGRNFISIYLPYTEHKWVHRRSINQLVFTKQQTKFAWVRARLSIGPMNLSKQLHMQDWLDIIHTVEDVSRECQDNCGSDWLDYNNRQDDTSKITYPPAWHTLNEIMDSIKTTIIKKTGIEAFEATLEEEYMKKYGVRISEFERSLMRVSFRDSTKFIDVRRNISGAAMIDVEGCTHCLPPESSSLCAISCLSRIVKLDTEEWMDFIRALYKIRIDRWSKFRGEDNRRREVTVFFSDTDKMLQISGCDGHISKRRTSITASSNRPKWAVEFDFSDSPSLWHSGNETYPPNWNEFRKLMTDLEAKFLNKSGN